MEEYDDGNTTPVHGRFQGAGGAGSAAGRQDDPGDCDEAQGSSELSEHMEASGD